MFMFVVQKKRWKWLLLTVGSFDYRLQISEKNYFRCSDVVETLIIFQKNLDQIDVAFVNSHFKIMYYDDSICS